MMRLRSRKCVLALAMGVTFALWAATSWSEPPAPVLFHASFDGTLDGTDARGAVKPLAVEGKVSYAPGRVGQALVCGGDAALVKYPVDGHLLASQGTIEMWVKTVDWPKDEQAFHVFFETEGPGWLVLYKFWTGGALFLSGTDHSHYGGAWWKDCTLLANSAWHHLAGVWNNKQISFYVDGTLKESLTLAPLPESFSGWFAIGDSGWGKPHASHTLVDEVTIFRYALPADQIALAAQGKPVTCQSQVSLTVQPHPAEGRWKVMVDASGYAGVAATVEILSDGKAVSSGKVTTFKDELGTVALDISQVPAGATVVRAKILDAAGHELAKAEIPFQKPADAPWINNTIGMEDKVLPPFTAMSAVGSDVQCWGRKYVMSGPFPVQIESAGQEMLSEPIRVSVATSKGEVSFQKTAGKVLNCSPTRAKIAGSAEAPEVGLTTETTIEYDGMLWTEVTLTPKAPTTLTDVTLHIPVRAANALYLHHSRANWSDDNAGLLPEKGYESVAFQHFLWLGDNDRGLGWFVDSCQGWSNVPGKPVQWVAREGGAAEMRISVVNRSTLIKAPFRFSFGLQATPVRPRPANYRAWRLCGANDDIHDLGKGNIQVLWFNNDKKGFNYMKHFGYPWPDDPEKFRAIVADLHARNIRVVPYVNLNYISSGADEFAYYGSEWLEPSMYTYRAAELRDKCDLMGACVHSKAWRDFIAWKIARFVDEFQVDGIYIDCWISYESLTEGYGGAWRDEAGQLHGNYELTARREITRRVREIFTDRRPDPCLIIHMSANVEIPQLAFADMILDGEQYQGDRCPKDDYLNVIPLEKWRAEHMGRQWGPLAVFLMENLPPQRLVPLPTERVMGLTLLHDIAPWPLWCCAQAIFDAWKAEDKFGIVDAKFLPYWEPNGVTTGNKDVFVSVYQKPGAALLVAYNSGAADAQVSLKANAKLLGLGTSPKARNPMDDSPLPVSDQGVKLTVPARNYRLVVLE